jgi:ABC-type uncharacterized transport system substrate-binding protein
MMYLVDFYGTLFDIDAKTLYPDGATFLRDKENSAIIVTSAPAATHAQLIKDATAGIPRVSVMHTDGVLKGEFLAPYIGMYGQSPVFVDDSEDQLEAMKKHNPDVQRFYMCRKDAAMCVHEPKDWTVVHSLAELP